MNYIIKTHFDKRLLLVEDLSKVQTNVAASYKVIHFYLQISLFSLE
jgi:hypothetical protein